MAYVIEQISCETEGILKKFTDDQRKILYHRYALSIYSEWKTMSPETRERMRYDLIKVMRNNGIRKMS